MALQKIDVEGKPLSVVFWTSLLRKDGSEFNYKNFTDLFIRPAMSLLNKTELPRVSEDIKSILQLYEHCKVGDVEII